MDFLGYPSWGRDPAGVTQMPAGASQQRVETVGTSRLYAPLGERGQDACLVRGCHQQRWASVSSSELLTSVLCDSKQCNTPRKTWLPIAVGPTQRPGNTSLKKKNNCVHATVVGVIRLKTTDLTNALRSFVEIKCKPWKGRLA